MSQQAKGPRKCGAQDVASLWLARVAAEVDSHIRTLGKYGWRLWDVAVKLDCSPWAIISWRKGAAEMPAT